MVCLAWLKVAGALHLAKVCSMVAVIVLVLVFNGQRPKVPHIYHTNDPYDTQRNGVSYVCGCSLPTSLETPQNPTDPPNSSWNMCYDRSSLQTKNVIVYPNFTGVYDLENGIANAQSDFYDVKMSTVVDGYLFIQRAHDLDWGDNRARFENYTNSASLLNFDLSEYTQSELFADVKDLEKLLEFPAAYLAMNFAFRCSNCSSCNLDSVTRNFEKASGDWGECTYWGEGDECALKNRYQAKCTMYPIARIPLAARIQGFFQDFDKLLDISDFRPLHYPDHNQPVASGTLVCNLVSSRANGYERSCLEMTEESICREMHTNVTINNVPNSTWNDFQVERDDWQGLMCPPDISNYRTGYLTVWQTAPAVQGSLLNKFLDSDIMPNERRILYSGMCTQTYSDIIPYTSQDENSDIFNMTVFMETDCSAFEHSDAYCWLTGRYRKLTDTPDTPWQTMADNSTAKDRFVCYNIGNQGVVTWFIFMVGILFGWLGSVDLAFNWIARFCCRQKSRVDQSSGAAGDAPNDEKQPEKDAGGTSDQLEADSEEMVAPEAKSETESRPILGLETNVVSEPSLHNAGDGPSGPIMELAKTFSRTRTYSRIREI